MKTPRPIAVDLTRLKCLHCGLGQFCLLSGRALPRATRSRVPLEFLLPMNNGQLLADLELPHRNMYPWMKEAVQRQYREWLAGLLPRQPRYALWHATTQNTRYLPLDRRIPVVLTIHDLNFLREKPPQEWARGRRCVQALVDRAAGVTTISHFVANEVRSQLAIHGKPLRVIYNGLIDEKYVDAAVPPFMDDKPFLFTIGDITPKKNFHVLVDMLARLPQYRLVVAGNNRTAYAGEVRDIAAQRGLAQRVILPGIVGDESRYWLYKKL